MIYCSKHEAKCKHLKQRFDVGSVCIYSTNFIHIAPNISQACHGDIEAPEWCPLREVSDDE